MCIKACIVNYKLNGAAYRGVVEEIDLTRQGAETRGFRKGNIVLAVGLQRIVAGADDETAADSLRTQHIMIARQSNLEMKKLLAKKIARIK